MPGCPAHDGMHARVDRRMRVRRVTLRGLRECVQRDTDPTAALFAAAAVKGPRRIQSFSGWEGTFWMRRILQERWIFPQFMQKNEILAKYGLIGARLSPGG